MQRDIFSHVKAFYGVLRHLKVHLVQHDILWLGGGSVRRIEKPELNSWQCFVHWCQKICV